IGAGGDRHSVSGLCREDAAPSPVSCDLLNPTRLVRKLRQLPDIRRYEVVRMVKGGRTIFESTESWNVDRLGKAPTATGLKRLAGRNIVERLGPRITRQDRQRMRQPPLQSRLEGVVVRSSRLGQHA